MNILITGCKKDVLAKIKKLVQEESVEREALDEQQKAETMEGLKEIVKPVEKFLEDYYKMFPSKRPINDIKRRPFDMDRVDNDFAISRDDDLNL